ncbi:tRNA (guanosine(37)-N1)-methyltransferase TrmD [Azohydromonas caseinilytica]|uniref:tRNA (guanine-N(1)-)-methyltransferase n=1 Tax=Azohydromonas caseinilytica TaxID=2728836 RepID=A0A848F431_9BURK|nr:tRNA (guanosine(37)-N1)-methyltransferase TrmD [Azohydromonas caseinilytica]NML14142.1 tRNA (guanosine(37)-N1)-methyltransferase TrmD [Azohydromonas caseinilytica]
MRFDVITLFPELFAPHLEVGVTRRAYVDGKLQLQLWPLRDFAEGNYRRVDDRPFGGGPGMVMMAPPLERALDAVHAARVQAGEGTGAGHRAPLIHFSPTGRRLDQALVRELAAGPGAVLLCGRYEGIDQRFIDRHVDMEVSLGDFVLSGGELPALVLLDAVARLQPGVLQDAASHQQDSFEDGLLDCPHYSRPEQLPRADGGVDAVPQVLLSGHHGRIARWRRERSLELTARRRPDLIAAARAAGRLSREDERFLQALDIEPKP